MFKPSDFNLKSEMRAKDSKIQSFKVRSLRFEVSVPWGCVGGSSSGEGGSGGADGLRSRSDEVGGVHNGCNHRQVSRGGWEGDGDGEGGGSHRVCCPVCSAEAKGVVEDDLGEVASAVVAAYESGALQEAVDGGHDSWQGWVKGLGKSMKRKVTVVVWLSRRKERCVVRAADVAPCEWRRARESSCRSASYSPVPWGAPMSVPLFNYWKEQRM